MPEIKGYRSLTLDEVADVNVVKELGENIREIWEYLRQGSKGYDQRWLAEGKTDLQKGLMSLTRAITQPTNF